MTSTFAFPVRRSRLVMTSALMGVGLVACGGSDDNTAKAYGVGGSVSGLTTSGLVLQNNGADDLAVAANAGTFVFATALFADQPYDVSVKVQPEKLTCTVSRGQGKVAAEVNDVAVTCGPVGGGGGAVDPGEIRTGAASACFNPALLTPGTTYRWHMQGTVEGQVISMIQDRQIEGNGSFGGASGLLIERGTNDVIMGSVSAMKQSVEHYYQLENTDAGPIVIQHGGLASSTTNAAGMTLVTEHEYVNTPPAPSLNFTLNAGQSYLFSATTRTTTRLSGMGAFDDTTTESYKITYMGQKEVTIAAGTFLACHFMHDLADGMMDTYNAVGSGLPLVTTAKIDDTGTVRMEMQPDSHVNGTPVTQHQTTR